MEWKAIRELEDQILQLARRLGPQIAFHKLVVWHPTASEYRVERHIDTSGVKFCYTEDRPCSDDSCWYIPDLLLGDFPTGLTPARLLILAECLLQAQEELKKLPDADQMGAMADRLKQAMHQ